MKVRRENKEPKMWRKFKEELSLQFKTIDEIRLARDKLSYLRQLTSVQEYIKEFRLLKFQILDLSEAEEFDKFRRGLKIEIQNEMDRRCIKEDLELLIESAQEYDILLFKQRRRFDNPRNTFNNNRGKFNMNRTRNTNFRRDKRINQISKEDQERLAKEWKCFKYEQIGHISKNCPKWKGKGGR